MLPIHEKHIDIDGFSLFELFNAISFFLVTTLFQNVSSNEIDQVV